MLPREEREERAVGKFLKYHNQTNDTSYQVVKWLDRAPHLRLEQPGPIPVASVGMKTVESRW